MKNQPIRTNSWEGDPTRAERYNAAFKEALKYPEAIQLRKETAAKYIEAGLTLLAVAPLSKEPAQSGFDNPEFHNTLPYIHSWIDRGGNFGWTPSLNQFAFDVDRPVIYEPQTAEEKKAKKRKIPMLDDNFEVEHEDPWPLFEKLKEAAEFDFENCVEVETRSGGRHYYFALPEGEKVRQCNPISPKWCYFDIRPSTGFVVAASCQVQERFFLREWGHSQDDTMQTYSFVGEPDLTKLTMAPEKLIYIINNKDAEKTKKERPANLDDEVPELEPFLTDSQVDTFLKKIPPSAEIFPKGGPVVEIEKSDGESWFLRWDICGFALMAAAKDPAYAKQAFIDYSTEDPDFGDAAKSQFKDVEQGQADNTKIPTFIAIAKHFGLSNLLPESVKGQKDKFMRKKFFEEHPTLKPVSFSSRAMEIKMDYLIERKDNALIAHSPDYFKDQILGNFVEAYTNDKDKHRTLKLDLLSVILSSSRFAKSNFEFDERLDNDPKHFLLACGTRAIRIQMPERDKEGNITKFYDPYEIVDTPENCMNIARLPFTEEELCQSDEEALNSEIAEIHRQWAGRVKDPDSEEFMEGPEIFDYMFDVFRPRFLR